MRAHAVGERGVGRGGEETAADDASFFRAAKPFDVGNSLPAGQKARAGHHRGDRVEYMVLRLFQHFVRQRFSRCLSDI
jgi:hypothetical protein